MVMINLIRYPRCLEHRHSGLAQTGIDFLDVIHQVALHCVPDPRTLNCENDKGEQLPDGHSRESELLTSNVGMLLHSPLCQGHV